MELPSLSVVMSNYNHGKYIRQALSAIVSQSVQPLELVVIDDASTDNSLSVIQEFVDRYPFIRLIENSKNKGGLANVNDMLPLLKGDYVYSAAADDIILPGFFEKSLKLFKQYPQAGLCSSLVWMIDGENNNKGLWPLPIVSLKACYLDSKKTYKLIYNNIYWMIGVSVIMRRKPLVELGGFKAEHHYLSDAFVSHYLALKYGLCFVPEPLVVMRRLDGAYSDTRNNLELTKKNLNNLEQSMKEFPDIFPAKYIEKCRDIEMLACSWRRWLFLSNACCLELSGLRKQNDFLACPFLFIIKMALVCLNLAVLAYLFVVYRNVFLNLVRAKLKYYLMVPFVHKFNKTNPIIKSN